MDYKRIPSSESSDSKACMIPLLFISQSLIVMSHCRGTKLSTPTDLLAPSHIPYDLKTKSRVTLECPQQLADKKVEEYHTNLVLTHCLILIWL